MQIKIVKNFIVLHATVNSAVEGRFLLDTGADATVIIPPFADRLGLKTTRHHVGGVAGGKRVEVPLSTLGALSVNGHSTPLDPVAIVEVNRDPGPYGRIDGIIGSDFLREFPVTIDYPGEVMFFEDQASLERRIQNGTVLSLTLRELTTPFLRVWLNGAPQGNYKLDTGAGMTHLPLADLASLGIKEGDRLVSVQHSSSLAGSYKVLRARLASFSLGPGLETDDCDVKAYECEYGFIGADYLKDFVVTLDYKGQRIVLARPN